MKITKFVHSCLLVETSEPDTRVALFDPGSFSTIQPDMIERLDDIFITHLHPDHMDVKKIEQLQKKFPAVRITAPGDAKAELDHGGVRGVITEQSEGLSFFDAPHESIQPLGTGPLPEEIGMHYLGMLTDPGDSHSFNETMPILALPVQAPWGSSVKAAEVALRLKPKYIIPVHDWHWRKEAQAWMYDRFEQRFREEGIVAIKPVDGQPFEINL